MTDATERFVDALIGHGKVVKPTGDGKYIAQCPAHDDGNPSLSVTRGRSGQVLTYCHAGCGYDSIVSAIGWQDEDMFDEPKGVTHNYYDRGGRLVRQVFKKPGRKYKQNVIVPDSKDLFVPKNCDLDGAMAAGLPVYIAEGEKDAISIATPFMGDAVSVSAAQGAENWHHADYTRIKDASELIVVVDLNDTNAVGLKRGRELSAYLRTITDSPVRVVKPKVGDDVTDHLVAGHTIDELVDVVYEEPVDEQFEEAVAAEMAWRSVKSEATKRQREIDSLMFAAKLEPETLGSILDTKFDDDWIIPGLLEKTDRLILTGIEGGGKSVMLRQISIMAAAGLHPFTREVIDPVKVLVIDAENSKRQWSRTAKYVTGLADKYGVRSPRNNVIVAAGTRIDLNQQSDVDQIHALIIEHEPDILMVGPLYKLVAKEITTDDEAAPLLVALDAFREHGPALLMEAHSGLAGKHDRNLRPRGSSALLGWPEFGFGLLPEENNDAFVDLVRWRGDREERDWPKGFRRGMEGELSWEPLRGDHV